jgi:hypothetical protein
MPELLDREQAMDGLRSYAGDFADDFDIEAVFDEVYEYDPRSGKFGERPEYRDIDANPAAQEALNDVFQRNDLGAKPHRGGAGDRWDDPALGEAIEAARAHAELTPRQNADLARSLVRLVDDDGHQGHPLMEEDDLDTLELLGSEEGRFAVLQAARRVGGERDQANIRRLVEMVRRDRELLPRLKWLAEFELQQRDGLVTTGPMTVAPPPDVLSDDDGKKAKVCVLNHRGHTVDEVCVYSGTPVEPGEHPSTDNPGLYWPMRRAGYGWASFARQWVKSEPRPSGGVPGKDPARGWVPGED